MKTTYKSKIAHLILAAILIFAGTVLVTANTGNKPAELSMEFKVEAEADLSVENWMVNLNAWEASEEIIFEESIKIESWMLEANEYYWNAEQDINREEDLQVEDWMTNLAVWNK